MIFDFAWGFFLVLTAALAANLTVWGYQSCQRDLHNGGGVSFELLNRT
jgi:hypothetical protein